MAKHHLYLADGPAVLGFKELGTLLCHIASIVIIIIIKDRELLKIQNLTNLLGKALAARSSAFKVNDI